MEGSHLISELAGVKDRLRSLPDNDFSERWELRNRQYELRDQIATIQASERAVATPATNDTD